MDFHGQHMAVTGGSSGIGLVTAQLLASRGARVSLVARRRELLDEAVAGIGENAAGFAADVGDKAQLEGALEAAAARFGPVHGLFANAGLTGGFTPAVAFDPAVFEETIRVNLTSVFWAIQKVLPAMIAARNGVILVTGSMGSKRGMAMNPAYVASKHGVLADPGDRLVEQFLAPRDQRHPRAAARQQLRGDETDPARAAGDDDVLAVEVHQLSRVRISAAHFGASA